MTKRCLYPNSPNEDDQCMDCECDLEGKRAIRTNAGPFCENCWSTELCYCSECGNIGEIGWEPGFITGYDGITYCWDCRSVDTAVAIEEISSP